MSLTFNNVNFYQEGSSDKQRIYDYQEYNKIFHNGSMQVEINLLMKPTADNEILFYSRYGNGTASGGGQIVLRIQSKSIFVEKGQISPTNTSYCTQALGQ